MRFCSDAKCRFMSVNVCARLRLPCRLFQGDASLLNSQTGQMNCEVEMKLSKPVLASTGLAPNPLTHSLTHSLTSWQQKPRMHVPAWFSAWC